jgi:monothiol glutaredoxin
MKTRMSMESPARPLLASSDATPDALARMASFHEEVVGEVKRAIATHPLVVVGMAQNPHVKKLRAALSEAGLDFHYLEYGSYLSKWKERLALKLWSGWPTFPQVYVKGTLIGGRELAEAAIRDGSLRARL